jgi:glycosyltransferase involved in cell wall biosynthesis
LITGCVVVQNEGHLLRDALESLAAVTDQLVVVDHGSVDNSAQIARELGALVIDGTSVHYEDARNLYLDHVSSGWVLVLDADERIVDPTPQTKSRLKRWLARVGDSPNAYALARYEYLGAGQCAVIDIVRLWKSHPSIRYTKSSWHASVVSSIEKRGGKLVPAPFAIHHLDVILPSRAQWKRERARTRGERELQKPDSSPLLHAYMGLEFAAIGDFVRAREQYALSAKKEPLCAPTAALFTAQSYLAEKDFARVEHYARQSLEGPRVFYGCYHGHLLLAEVALAYGRFDQAWDHAVRARNIRRSYATAHLNLAALARHVSRSDAQTHLARAHRCNPWIFADTIYSPGETPTIFTHQYSALSIARDARAVQGELTHTRAVC